VEAGGTAERAHCVLFLFESLRVRRHSAPSNERKFVGSDSSRLRHDAAPTLAKTDLGTDLRAALDLFSLTYGINC